MSSDKYKLRYAIIGVPIIISILNLYLQYRTYRKRKRAQRTSTRIESKVPVPRAARILLIGYEYSYRTSTNVSELLCIQGCTV